LEKSLTVIRPQPNGLLEFLRRFGGPLQLPIGIAELEMRVGILRVGADRLPQGIHRLIPAAGIDGVDGAVVMVRSRRRRRLRPGNRRTGKKQRQQKTSLPRCQHCSCP
jgi:hypothetical protein